MVTLFILFACVFAVLFVGMVWFTIQCFRTRNGVAYWLSVPAILLALVFLSFTIFFIRRIAFLV